MDKVSSAVSTCKISSSVAAGNTRFVTRLGFNTIQGSMVRVEGRECSKGGEDVGSGDESKKEDPRSRA